jgi:hypothetical protein
MLIATSAEQVLHVHDQGLCPLTPGDTIQAKLLRFIVLAALDSKGGEGPQRQELTYINTGLLQQHEQTGNVVAVGHAQVAPGDPQQAFGFRGGH